MIHRGVAIPKLTHFHAFHKSLPIETYIANLQGESKRPQLPNDNAM